MAAGDGELPLVDELDEVGQHAPSRRLVELGPDVGVQLGHDRRDRVDTAPNGVDDLTLTLEPMRDERRSRTPDRHGAATRGSG